MKDSENDAERVPLRHDRTSGASQHFPPPSLLESKAGTKKSNTAGGVADDDDPFALDARSVAASRTKQGLSAKTYFASKQQQVQERFAEHQGRNCKTMVVFVLSVLACIMAFGGRKQAMRNPSTAAPYSVTDALQPIPASPSGLESTAPSPAASVPTAPPDRSGPEEVGIDTPPPALPPKVTPRPTSAPTSASRTVDAPSWARDLPMLSTCANSKAPAFIACDIAYLVNTTLVNLCSKTQRCAAVYSTTGVVIERANGPQRITNEIASLAMRDAKNSGAVVIQKGDRPRTPAEERWKDRELLERANTSDTAAKDLLSSYFTPFSLIDGGRAFTPQVGRHADWVVPELLLSRQIPLGSTASPDKLPQPMMVFESAVLMPEPTCLTNLWHGLFENVLPLFDALVRSGIIGPLHGATPWPDAPSTPAPLPAHGDATWKRVAFFWDMPRRDAWAQWNHGCMSRQSWPYGVDPRHWLGRMLLHVMNANVSEVAAQLGKGPLPRGRPLLGNVFFNSEARSQHGGEINPWQGTARILGATVIGLPRTCTQFYSGSVDPARRASRRSGANGGGSVRWPYYSDGAHHSEGGYCAELTDRLRMLLVEKEKAALDVPDAPVDAEERRCPRVLILRRQVNASGRVIQNYEDVRDALTELIRRQCPSGKFEVSLVRLEELPVPDQIRLVHRSTILVAARGAGTVNIIFQRPGAGYLSLSIANREVAVDRDQYPWYPMISFMRRRHAVIMNCDAIVDRARVTNSACLTVSVNFCDMVCPVTTVKAAAARLLSNMATGSSNQDASPQNFTGIVPTVTERNGVEFFE